MTKHTLEFAAFLNLPTAAHLSRASVKNTRPKFLHSHDFYELFWVQNGKVVHHTPDGTQTLVEGDLVFVRPGQTHAIQGRGTDPFVVSLAFHPAFIEETANHASLAGKYFWADTPAPIVAHRDSMQLAALNSATLTLERSACDSLAAAAFLLPLCATLITETTPLPGAPDWLNDAYINARDPRVFREGAAGFVKLTGRAHPHVSRTMKTHSGQSPSEYINDLRMAHAARALRSGQETIAEIADDCGLPNLSHFHKLFRAHFDMTPHDYRQAHQQQIAQPS